MPARSTAATRAVWTIAEAAAHHDRDPNVILKAIKRGEIGARQAGRTWILDKKQAEAWRPGRVGRPRKEER